MAKESVTTVVEFDRAPAYPCGLFQVNAGIETTFATGMAEIVNAFIRERMHDAVGGDPLQEDEAYVYALLTDMVGALYRASGAVS